jgi:3-dehydroquinate dehydratase-2
MSDRSIVAVYNGPNLNLLGRREPDIYGRTTLQEIEKSAAERAKTLGFALDFRQTNHEGALIDWIQAAISDSAGLIINPGALTHTSIALHDALKSYPAPKIELHLSNVHAREAFRRTSFVSPVVDGVLAGFGAEGYLLALDAMRRLIDNRPAS